MSNYVKAVNFAAKDALLTGDPNKKAKGTEVDTEFNAIATAVATKEDTANKGANSGYVGFDANKVAQVGGINNTGSTIPANGEYLPSANTLGFASNTAQRATVNSVGEWTFNVPSSGTNSTASFVCDNGGLATQLNTSVGFGGLTIKNQLGARHLEILYAGSTSGGFYGIAADTSIINAASSTNGLVLATSDLPRLKLSNAGNLTVVTPTSGVSLTINATSLGTALSMTDGTVTSAMTFASTQLQIGTTSAHPLVLTTNGPGRLTISANGNVTIAAPTSGVALGVTGFSGSSPLTLTPAGATDYALTVLAPAAGNSAVQLQINAALQGIVGISGAAGQLIGSSVLNDLCIRSVNGAIRFAGALNSSTQMILKTDGSVVVTGAMGINGVASAPALVSGWGTPTGATVLATFPGATATLAQCSGVIAKLITDLKAFGLYGS